MRTSPVELLRYCERRLAPSLYPRVSAGKAIHVGAVNNAFSAIVSGNLDMLYRALPPDMREKTNYDTYIRSLAHIRELYFSLPQKEKRNLAVAVAMHDVGYQIDKGTAHAREGAKIVGQFVLSNGIYGVDIDAIAELVRFHEIYDGSLVLFPPQAVKQLTPERKTQCLLLNICDWMGDPKGNLLSLRTLNILIGLKEGKYDDPEEYYRLRLRTLLGPSGFSYIESDADYQRIFDAIDKWPRIEQERFKENVAKRFRNMCWPVFQEIGIKRGRIDIFLSMLRKISEAASVELAQAEDVLIFFRPDFFFLDYKDRIPYLQALLRNPESYRLETSMERELEREHGVIIITLSQA